jgi:hypothetical protein
MRADSHLYMYAASNPVNYRDPTGYFAEKTIKDSLDGTDFGFEWGELEVNWAGYRPKFSGLLAILKHASVGDRLRSGRLDWRIRSGMTMDWTKEWRMGVTASCPQKIVLSRDRFFGAEDKTLSSYIHELIAEGLPQLYLGGGYVYHEHSFSGGKDRYRDGANSLVPDLIMWEVTLASEPIPIIDVGAGPRGRMIVDRFGNLYLYSGAKAQEGSAGVSVPFSGDLVKHSMGSVYIGDHYANLTSVADTPRAQIEELDLIDQISGDGSKTSWGAGNNVSWKATPYFGVAYAGIGGNPSTRFTYSPSTLLSMGSSAYYSHVSHLGRLMRSWDGIDDGVMGVSWEDALNEPAYCAAGIDCTP